MDSQLNPYASFLGKGNALETIRATPRRLGELYAKIGAKAAERSPAAGKWGARHILAHLADTEMVFAFRLRQALAQDHHVIQPFDQEQWARTYDVVPANTALQVFGVIRQWNILLIGTTTEADLSKPLSHPERGQMTFKVLLETMAGHDLNHIRQLEKIAELPSLQ